MCLFLLPRTEIYAVCMWRYDASSLVAMMLKMQTRTVPYIYMAILCEIIHPGQTINLFLALELLRGGGSTDAPHSLYTYLETGPELGGVPH